MSAIKRHVIKPLTAAIRYARLPLASWATLALLPGTVWAGPQGEQVVAGAVAVARPDAHTTRVTQSGDKAIVNWNSFSVGGQEYVQFVQPGSTSAILNRVVGGQASQILGHLNANGRVFLVNPQGVYFGAGAKVDTAGLVASVLDINDQDFIDSRYVFTKGAAAAEAEVRNSGEINTSQFAVLIGDRVANEGLIEARLGTVALGAGSKVSLSLDQTGLVNFAVDEKTLARHAGVENTGTLLANGGRVLLTAKVADDLLATAVNNTGVIRAQGITEHNGEIILSATGGNVVNRGTLDASGPTGGQVLVSATHDVEIAPTAQVLAEGTGAGHGGSVRLIAEHSLAVRDGARVATRGGEAGGRGGLVELSAHHGGLAVAAHAVTVGSGGRLVIDPARLLIASTGNSISGSYIGKDYIETQLNLGVSLDLIAASSVGAVAANHVDAASPFTITAAGLGDLHIKLGAVAGSSFSLGAFSLDAFARGAAGNINLSSVSINIGGNFEALAGSQTGRVSLGQVTANDITIGAGSVSGATVVTSALTATGGSVAVEGYNISVNGNVRASDTGAVHVQLMPESGGYLSVTGDIRVKSLSSGSGSNSARINLGRDFFASSGAASINVSGLIEAEGRQGGIEVYAQGDVTLGGLISVLGQGGSASLSIFAAAVSMKGATVTTAAGGFRDASIDITARNGISVVGNLTAQQLNSAAYGSASIRLYNGSASSATGNITVTGNLLALTSGSGDASIDLRNNTAGGGITVTGTLAASGGGDASIDITAAQGDVTLGGDITVLGQAGSASLSISGDAVSLKGATVTAQGSSDSSASIDISARNGISVVGNLTALQTNLAGSGSASIYLYNGSAIGNITVTGNLLAVASGAGDASIDLYNYAAGGGITVTGTLGATGGDDASIDIHANQGGVTLGGDITVLGQGGSASLSISGDAVSMRGATVKAEGGSASLPGNAGIDILAGSSFGGSSSSPSVNATGLLTINGALLADAATGSASISLAGTSVTVSAPVTAQSVAVPSTLLVGVSGGALTTLGAGILQADSVTLVGLGSTQSFSVRTNTQHLTLTKEIFGLNAGVLSGVNLYLDNTAYAGPTLVDTNTNIQAFIDPVTGTRFADTLITGLAFSSARMLFTGDVGFAGDVAANNMAVDVANGVLVFSGIGIGEVPLSGDFGDAYSLALLAQAAQAAGVSLALPQYNGAPTTGANAIFAARNGLTFSDGLTLDDPDVPYVAFLTDGLLDFGPGVLSINPSRQDFLAQFSSYTPGATVHIENVLPSTLDGTGPYFVNDLNFQLLPGTTLLAGGTLTPTGSGLPHPGPVLIGQNGALNIGHQNAFFVANGAITGAGNVISTGFVAVGGTPVPPSPVPPAPAPTPSTPDSLSSGTVAGAVLADAANGDLMLASVLEDDSVLDDDEEDENDPGYLEEAASNDQSGSGLGGKSNTGQMCE